MRASEVEANKGDDIRDAESDFYGELIDEVRVIEGARELIAGIEEREIAIVLASSASSDEVEHYVEMLGAADQADWTTSSDVENTKPEPDLVEAALEKAGTRDAVMVGDTVWDVKAAERAGVPAIGVLTGGFSEAELSEAGAVAVYESAMQLAEQPRLGALPMIGTIGEGTRLGGGRYTLQERLGSGGAATVWLADDSVLERPVAVKVLSEALASDENWLARFEREARIAAGLSHPNLVSVYDFDAGDERPYIVMAHMPGGSLWDRMQTGERSDPEPLADDILTALEAIHSAGIIHRDIKPGNVLFAADGTACLTDFGVARPEDATSLTQTGQIPGTAKFMAPELWEGEPADERTDLFAAGVVLRDAIGNDAPPALVTLVDRLDRRTIATSGPHRRPRPSTSFASMARPAPAPTPALPPLPEGPTASHDRHPGREPLPPRPSDRGRRASCRGCDRRDRAGAWRRRGPEKPSSDSAQRAEGSIERERRAGV